MNHKLGTFYKFTSTASGETGIYMLAQVADSKMALINVIAGNRMREAVKCPASWPGYISPEAFDLLRTRDDGTPSCGFDVFERIDSVDVPAELEKRLGHGYAPVAKKPPLDREKVFAIYNRCPSRHSGDMDRIYNFAQQLVQELGGASPSVIKRIEDDNVALRKQVSDLTAWCSDRQGAADRLREIIQDVWAELPETGKIQNVEQAVREVVTRAHVAEDKNIALKGQLNDSNERGENAGRSLAMTRETIDRMWALLPKRENALRASIHDELKIVLDRMATAECKLATIHNIVAPI